MHQHSGLELVLALPPVIAAATYLAGVSGERRRGRAWPRRRTFAWLAGVIVAALAPIVAISSVFGGGYAAHLASYLMIGVLAPALLVLGSPITLALRTMAPVPARRLAAMTGGRLAAVLRFPPVAAIIALAPLWVLLQPSTVDSLSGNALLHALVLGYFLASGTLLAAAIAGMVSARHPVPPAPAPVVR